MHKNLEATKNVWAIIPGSAPPTTRLIGMVYVEADLPPENDKHIALGRFLDTWSKLELQLRQYVQKFLFTAHEPTARTVAYTLSQRTLSDMLLNLASMHLSGKDRAAFNKLCERYGKLNTKRNYLVHGSWVLEAVWKIGSGIPFRCEV